MSSQKIANNPHPVYIKQSSNQDYYLYFRQNGNQSTQNCKIWALVFTLTDAGGPQGWIVGPQLLEDSFYLTTQSTQSACPAGIFGGYDSDDTTKDDTFSIQCHSDMVIADYTPMSSK